MKMTDKARVARFRKAVPESSKLSDTAALFLIKEIRIRKTKLDNMIKETIGS